MFVAKMLVAKMPDTASEVHAGLGVPLTHPLAGAGPRGGLLWAPVRDAVTGARHTSENTSQPCPRGAPPESKNVNGCLCKNELGSTRVAMFCAWVASLGNFLALTFIFSPLYPQSRPPPPPLFTALGVAEPMVRPAPDPPELFNRTAYPQSTVGLLQAQANRVFAQRWDI